MKQTRISPVAIAFLLVLLCALLVLPKSVAAQTLRPVPPPVNFTVTGAEKPIELRTLGIETEIIGPLAWTTVEMSFHNPNNRVLEGELQFPLQDGQTVTGFALSMENRDGKEVMRDAVPVNKVKGRQVFENVIRQKIDPALLEVTQGNNFKLRVYPLNPGKTRRVKVTYSEHLSPGGNGIALYRLPLSYADRVQQFSFRFEAQGLTGAPGLAGENLGNPPAGLAPDFRQKDGAYIALAEARNLRLQGNTLTLTLPVGNDGIYVGDHDGKRYFYTEIAAPPGSTERVPPKKLDILWDASLSGQKRNHAREFEFLDAFFTQVRDVSVRLQEVRDVAAAPREFAIRGGDWNALRKALETVVYDGATNLGAFDVGTPSDLFLLFSDGLDNYSSSPLAPPASPLFALISAPGAETSRLRGLAAKGGGLIDLTATDAKTATARVMQIRPHIAAVEGGISDAVWTQSPRNGTFLVAGVFRDASRPLRVVFAGEGGQGIERRFPAGQKDFDGIAHLWAAVKIERLEEEYELNRGEIRRLGQAFAIATRETSLIVLDRVEDYVTHDIEPPAELTAEYEQLRARMRTNRGETNKVARVLREWEQRDAWWQKDFPKDRPSAEKEKAQYDSRRAGSAGAGDWSARESVSLAPARVARAPSLQVAASAPAAPAIAPAPNADRSLQFTAIPDTGNRNESPAATIALRPWSPDAPYIRRMKDARAEDLYRIYLDERPDFENSVAFYLDVSYELGHRGQKDLSLRVLSNLAEMNLENRQILRVLGYRLLEADRPKQAVLIFRRVLALADDEPQSFRDLGLAHEAAGEYQLAVERLYDVVEKSFARRFPGIEVIALTEMNAAIAAAPAALDTRRIDSRFLLNRPLDLRVVLTWDSDNTDIDLHVIDPNNEEAFYSHPLSYQGGRVSPDNTEGYGPEEFTLKNAKPGKYRIEVNFYGHQQQMISEATTIQLDFFTQYVSEKVKKQSVTMRLKDRKDRILIGEFEVR